MTLNSDEHQDPSAESVAARPAQAALESLPSGPLGRQVFILALPMLGEQLANFMVGMVDTYLAGDVNKEATVAVGIASYMGWFITLAFTLVGVGAAAFVSRLFGARDVATANRALNQSMLIAFVIGVAVTVVVFAATPLFADLLMRTEASNAMTVRYLRIDAWSYTAASLTFVGAAVLRAAGDTRTPMNIMIVVNIVNIIVSAGLVYGWYGVELGVTGIALGTVIARCIGGVLILVVLFRGVRGLRIERRLLTPDPPIVRRILRIGLPASGEASIMWVAQIVFIGIITRTGEGAESTVNFAAHLIAVRLEGITYLPAMAWMTAAGTLVGQYLGSKELDKAGRAGHVAALQGGLLTTCVGVVFFVFAETLYHTMSNDAAVHAVGIPAFRIMAFFQTFLGLGIIYVGSLRGAGDTRATMIITAISHLAVRVPLAYLFGIVLEGGLLGAWIGMWGDNVLRFVLVAGRYTHGGWKKIKV